MKLFTLHSCESWLEAHTLRSLLEAEGIPCFLADEYMTSLNPLYNIALGGIRIQVPEVHFQKANEVLSIYTNPEIQLEDGTTFECPHCRSSHFYHRYWSFKTIRPKLTLLLSFALGIYPIYSNQVYKCKNCGWETTTIYTT